MRFIDFLDPRNVLLDLQVPDRDTCLRRIAESLAESGAIADVPGTLRKLIEREQIMSTGIYPGIAVPHCYTNDARRSACALARVAGGVDFSSLDGGRVQIVFCLLGPPEATDQHVKILARIARLVDMPGVLDDLKMAATADSLVALLKTAEKRLP